MLFCQFSGSQSLRKISYGLSSATGNLNHLGLDFAPCKSAISYLNKNRGWEVFRSLYYELLGHYSGRFKQTHFKIPGKIYLLDASIVSLCLKAFDWAHYRTAKGGIKLHTLLDFDGCMPAFLHISEGRDHEAKVAKEISIPKGSVVVADRGFLDFQLMSKWNSDEVNFVVRSKGNIKYEMLEQFPIPEENRKRILADEKVKVTGYPYAYS